MNDGNAEDASLISIMRGAGFFAVGKGSATVLGFLLNLLLTRGLGPTLFGIYTLARTIVETVGSISNLGADKAVLRFVSEQHGPQNAQLGVSYLIAFVGGIIVGSILFLTAPWISTHTLDDTLFITGLRLLSGLLVLNGVVIITGNAFRAIDRPELNSIVRQVLKPFFAVLFVAIALYFSLPFIGIIMTILISMIITAIIGIGLLYRLTPLRPSFGTDNIDMHKYFSYSFPLALKGAGSVLYTRIDILIVGIFLAASAVGYYQIAILLSSMLTLPLAAVSQIFPPVISRLHSSGDRKAMAQVFKTSTRWVLTGTLPAATGLIVFRNELLFLFGSDFTTASAILVLFAFGQLSNAFVGPSGYLLMMTDRQFIVTINQWVFGVTNVGLNILFIQQFGLIGAALATAGVLIGINLTRLSEVYYYESIHPFSAQMWKPVFATVLAGAAMLVFQTSFPQLINLLLGGIVGLGTYIGALAVLGIEDSDKALIIEWAD